MNAVKIKTMVEGGIKNINLGDLIAAYQFITKSIMNNTNCEECDRRKAIRKIIEYYNERKLNELKI